MAVRPRLTGKAVGPRLVVIGHVGHATDQTADGVVSYVGGSGYAAAFAASTLLPGAVGLVTQVGRDFEPASLRRLSVNLDGVAVLPGDSARFGITEFGDGTRSFQSDLGVAMSARRDLFPESYLQAAHIHLGTAPPRQQLAWIKFLRGQGCRSRISVDMFEHFVATQVDDSRRAGEAADLIFLNELEFKGLYGDGGRPRVPMIVKSGPGGAEIITPDRRYHAGAPSVHEVDPVGAGEIFAGAFLALVTHGLAEPDALRHAVSAASASVTEFGVNGPRVTEALALISRQAG
jgi:sugar/nucleoside kinase (ribokinase family)